MYNTDKVRSGLLVEYEKLFQEFKDKDIKYLEIGIKEGGSLLWARDFFADPKTWIFGIDINCPEGVYGHQLLKLVCDQNDSVGLEYIGTHHGKFDIIIDDASHQIHETQNTFDCLWKYLKNGGWYIIEDWVPGIGTDTFKGLIPVLVNILTYKNEFGISDVRITGRPPCACFRKY